MAETKISSIAAVPPDSPTSSSGNSSTTTEKKPKKEAKSYSNWSKLLRPWKWKRKKKSEKFSKTAATLERKISVRSTKDDLIKRGVFSEVNPPATINEVQDDERTNADHPENGHVKASSNISDKLEHININNEANSAGSSNISPNVDTTMSISNTPPQPLKRASLQNAEQSEKSYKPNSTQEVNINNSTKTEVIQKPVAAKRTKKNVLLVNPNAKKSPPKPPPKPKKSDSEDSSTEVLFATNVDIIPSENEEDDAIASSNETKLSEQTHVVESDSESSIVYRDDTDEDEEEVPVSGLAAKVARKDTLALKLTNRSNVDDSNDERSSVRRNISRHLSQRPTKSELEERNILPQDTAEQRMKEREKVKRQLTRKLSMRPTVQELIERKVLHWHEYVEVYEVHHYDRRGDKPWTRLTATDKATIRKELNEFKANEMEVHEESKKFTRFHRP